MSDSIANISSFTQADLDQANLGYSLDVDGDGEADATMLEIMASDIKDGVTTNGSTDDLLAAYYYYTDTLPPDLLENPSQYEDIWANDACVNVINEIRIDNPGTLGETLTSLLKANTDIEISLVQDVEAFLEDAYTNLDETELEDTTESTDFSEIILSGGTIRSVMLMFCIAYAQVTQESESALMERFEENLEAQEETVAAYEDITDAADDPVANLAETEELDLQSNMQQLALTSLTDNMNNVEKMLETLLTFTSEVVSSEYRTDGQILSNF